MFAAYAVHASAASWWQANGICSSVLMTRELGATHRRSEVQVTTAAVVPLTSGADYYIRAVALSAFRRGMLWKAR